MDFISVLKKLLLLNLYFDNSKVKSNFENKLSSHIHLDFEELIDNEFDLDDLKLGLIKLRNSLLETTDEFNSNEFAKVLYRLMESSADKKYFLGFISKIPDDKGCKLMELIDNCIKLLNNESIFDTQKNIFYSQLIGEWISIKSDDYPDYDINFNMTDYSPSYSEIKITFNQDTTCNILIPARDYKNPEIKEIEIVSGYCEINEGTIFIKQRHMTSQMPVLIMEESELKINFFKTNITFKRIVVQ